MDDLIERAQAGDSGAMDALIERTYNYIKGFLVRHASCYAHAEEATQETYLRLLTAIHSYRPTRAAFLSWLCAVAWHRLSHIERREQLRLGVPLYEDAAIADDVERMVLDGLDEQRARHVCALLGEYQRRCLELRFVRGLEPRDIAALLGTTPRSVIYATHHGIGTLRARLTDPAAYHARPDLIGEPGQGARNGSGRRPQQSRLV